MRFTKVAADYDPTDRQAVANYLQEHQGKRRGPDRPAVSSTQRAADMHEMSGTTDVPLAKVPFEKLCPGNAALDKLQQAFR